MQFVGRLKSLLVVAVALVFLSTPEAHAFRGEKIGDEAEYAAFLQKLSVDGVAVFFECQMLQTPVDCEEISREFFRAHGSIFRRVPRKDESDIWVKMTDRVDAGEVRYIQFEWKAREAIDTPDLNPAPYRIDFQSTPINVAVNQIATQMAAHAAYYLRVISAVTTDQSTVVVFESLNGAVGKKPYDGPLFLDLNMSANGNRNGANSSFYASGTMNATYSTAKFKVTAFSHLSHQNTTAATADGKLSGNNTAVSSSLRGIYSFHKRWSVAIYGYHYQDPGNNVDGMRDAITGVEWILVPFRQTQLTEAYVRAGTGIADMDLGSKNALGWDRRTYAFLFAYGFVRVPLINNKLTASFRGSAYQYPEFKGYQRFSAMAEATYQVTGQVRLQGSYTLDYRKRSLTFPANPDYSNPLQTSFLRNAPGLSTQFSLGIGITLGNSRRQQEDRRWVD